MNIYGTTKATYNCPQKWLQLSLLMTSLWEWGSLTSHRSTELGTLPGKNSNNTYTETDIAHNIHFWGQVETQGHDTHSHSLKLVVFVCISITHSYSSYSHHYTEFGFNFTSCKLNTQQKQILHSHWV